DGDRGAITDRALVAQRHRRLAALETDADADPVLGTDAGGTGGHVEHRGAHRTLAINATVHVAQASIHFTLEHVEAVGYGLHAAVGIAVGGGDAAIQLALVDRIGGRGTGCNVGDLALVALAADRDRVGTVSH